MIYLSIPSYSNRRMQSSPVMASRLLVLHLHAPQSVGPNYKLLYICMFCLRQFQRKKTLNKLLIVIVLLLLLLLLLIGPTIIIIIIIIQFIEKY